MSKRNDQRKNVVVVGGGFAGFTAVKILSAKLDRTKYSLTLVTARPYYIHLISGARFTVTSEGDFEDRSIIPYDGLFVNGNGTHVVGTVTAIEESAPGKGGNVVLQKGDKIPYDSLIIATGSIWPGALNFPNADEEVRGWVSDWRRKYANAKHVVIIGGGAVGIETAGEIKEAFPRKKVTIIHRDSDLLNDTYPDKYRKDMLRRVRKFGIQVILGDAVDPVPEPNTVGLTTAHGKNIPDADLIIPAYGSRPNTSFINTLDSTVLTDRGLVKVKPTLEIVGHPGVFAAGDIIDWKEQKQAAKAGTHGKIAAANVISFVQGLAPSKEYKGSPELIIIPIGSNGGGAYFGILWGLTFGDWVSRLLKSKDLMVSMVRKEFGQS
ncbi:FAD/NAD-P-binding domain-containing protein [Panus rudis PR-1116 ss-1]|nr:FAD/NAD-P-binding domain-containing protein [Panus rudis PR-1116 ss-1]